MTGAKIAVMTAAIGAKTGAMTAVTGAMTAATGVADPGCYGDSSTRANAFILLCGDERAPVRPTSIGCGRD